MYDKASVQWTALLAEEEQRLAAAPPELREALAERVAWMRDVEFAVVVSQGQNEIADLKAKGLDILPHRKRMQEEDLEARFKNPKDPLRLVFVCAMWITGFDVPTCSTVYLDKPMKNHTLMQTIARANRRAPGKAAGVVVDYVGVFKNLQKALAIYAATRGGDTPIQDKDALVAELEEALAEARTFCREAGVDLDAICAAEKLPRLKLISDAAEELIAPDELRRQFLRKAGATSGAYKALLPDERAVPYLKPVAVLHVLAEVIRGKLGPVDISAISAKIEALLDQRVEGVAITAPIIPGDDRGGRVDLSDIDFEKLAKLFQQRPRTANEKLRSAAEEKARDLASRNPTRAHLVEKLEKLVEAYNLGTLDAEAFFEALKKLIAQMEDEERRAAREGLTEDELAVFDLLTRPEPKLTKAQEADVKRVARELLEKLQGLRVEHWRQKQETRAAVHSEIRFKLNELPEEPYPEGLWDEKVEAVWQFVYGQAASSAGRAAAVP
jgi:type I restriction enzyme R subunit